MKLLERHLIKAGGVHVTVPGYGTKYIDVSKNADDDCEPPDYGRSRLRFFDCNDGDWNVYVIENTMTRVLGVEPFEQMVQFTTISGGDGLREFKELLNVFNR